MMRQIKVRQTATLLCASFSNRTLQRWVHNKCLSSVKSNINSVLTMSEHCCNGHKFKIISALVNKLTCCVKTYEQSRANRVHISRANTQVINKCSTVSSNAQKTHAGDAMALNLINFAAFGRMSWVSRQARSLAAGLSIECWMLIQHCGAAALYLRY